uniref:NADH-ubiquinone oxidoreductase chain 4 n=1 Tax=Mogannia minuta TaxID=2170271 RepID=A0A344ALT8_9HEMI|nr:NADH dehydrogenase subunit 4 [Mogannia minuta]
MLKFMLFTMMLIPLYMFHCFIMNMIIMSMMIFIVTINKNMFMLNYELFVDNISYGMIILTVWISFLMLLSESNHKYNMNMLTLMILLLMIFLILSFLSFNLLMFYVFFESSLIPTMIIIMGWGYQPERINASYYLMFYTLFASFPLLLSIMYLYNNTMSMIMFNMYMYGNWTLYLGLILAFLVKIPLFMFHFWLPKAHVEAPVSGSMILAGILLKLGAYGLMRVEKIIPIMFNNFSFIWISISMLGSMLVGFNCLIQVDIKAMIAYSSVAHMGLVVGGIMTMNDWGINGSYYMMIGHGLCSSGLFCLVNIMYQRTGSRSILINKGMLTFMPSMSLMWFLLCSSNMSSPPSLNLAGEICIINSLISWSPICILMISVSSFMSACYCLYLFSSSQHGMYYSSIFSFNSGKVQEYMLIIMHWLPLNLILLNLNIFM